MFSYRKSITLKIPIHDSLVCNLLQHRRRFTPFSFILKEKEKTILEEQILKELSTHSFNFYFSPT